MTSGGWGGQSERLAEMARSADEAVRAVALPVSAEQAAALDGLCQALRAGGELAAAPLEAALAAVGEIAQAVPMPGEPGRHWRASRSALPEFGGHSLLLEDSSPAGPQRLHFNLDEAGALYYGAWQADTAKAPIAFAVFPMAGGWGVRATDGRSDRRQLLDQRPAGLAWSAMPQLQSAASVPDSLGQLLADFGQLLADQVKDQVQGAAIEAGPVRLADKLGPSSSKPAAVPASVQTCLHCGAFNEGDAQFCRRCGTRLVTEAPPSYCSNCGAPRNEGSRFCIRCGHAAA